MQTRDPDGDLMHPQDLLWRIHDRFKLIEALAFAVIEGKEFSSEPIMRMDVAEGIYQIGVDFAEYRKPVEEWYSREAQEKRKRRTPDTPAVPFERR